MVIFDYQILLSSIVLFRFFLRKKIALSYCFFTVVSYLHGTVQNFKLFYEWGIMYHEDRWNIMFPKYSFRIKNKTRTNNKIVLEIINSWA